MKHRKRNSGKVLRDGESYRKSDGRYMFRWTDKMHKRHVIYANSLEKLREKEIEVLKDIENGIWEDVQKITLDDIYNLWINNKPGLKDATKVNYIYMYEHFIQPKLGHEKIRSIKKSTILTFYNSLIQTEGKEKPLSINTLDNINSVLRQVLQVAVVSAGRESPLGAGQKSPKSGEIK